MIGHCADAAEIAEARTSATISRIALARRRYEVLFAMPRDGTRYQPDSAPTD